MTVSFTRSFKRWLPELLPGIVVALCLFAGMAAARAQASAEIPSMRVEQTDEGVFLTATLEFELPAAADDALHKGIPVYFVAQAEIVRERWYWFDQQVAKARRYMRLDYQPLTRRWRLVVAPEPITTTGLGVMLAQELDTREDALAQLKRVALWKIADADALTADTEYEVQFRFELDVSGLPRPLQISAMGSTDWRLHIARTMHIQIGKTTQ